MAGLGLGLAKNTLGRPLLMTGLAASGYAGWRATTSDGEAGQAFKDGLGDVWKTMSQGISSLRENTGEGWLSEAEDSLGEAIGDNWLGRLMANHGTEATLLTTGAALTFLGASTKNGPALGWGLTTLAAAIWMIFQNQAARLGRFNSRVTDYSGQSGAPYVQPLPPDLRGTFQPAPDVSSSFRGSSPPGRPVHFPESVLQDEVPADENHVIAIQGYGKHGGGLFTPEGYEDPDFNPDLEDGRPELSEV